MCVIYHFSVLHGVFVTGRHKDNLLLWTQIPIIKTITAGRRELKSGSRSRKLSHAGLSSADICRDIVKARRELNAIARVWHAFNVISVISFGLWPLRAVACFGLSAVSRS